jgi:N-acetylglucosaminyldiphosphoundecaprenol N-acetyl-beta-D-mannosaminyltransferase
VEDLDDLSREVYCVLGLPIDVIEINTALQRLDAAVANATPYLISTPNVRFLVASECNLEFREALLMSDLCLVDGMPIVWIARMLGIPIQARIAGSDLLDVLKVRESPAGRLKVFLFGGAKGVADAASHAINLNASGVHCVGTIYPGFGSVEEMSNPEIIAKINSSRAEFLIVALGSEKGQIWLRRNHRSLNVAVRAHLGAALNFQAGTVRRAPRRMREMGLEWLWRIKEEPHLWRRYFRDGRVLLRLLLTHLLPLTLFTAWLRFTRSSDRQDLAITREERDGCTILALSGAASKLHVAKAVSNVRDALRTDKPVVFDWSGVEFCDPRFLGFILVMRKYFKEHSQTMTFVGISPQLRRMFRRNGVGFLLGPDRTGQAS